MICDVNTSMRSRRTELLAPAPREGGKLVVRSAPGQECGCRWQTMSFLSEFLRFLRTRKRFWLLPLLIVMLLFGALIVLAESTAIAPFIYTLF